MQHKNAWTTNDMTKTKIKRISSDCVEEETNECSNLAKQKPSKVPTIFDFSRKCTLISQSKADFSIIFYLYLPMS